MDRKFGNMWHCAIGEVSLEPPPPATVATIRAPSPAVGPVPLTLSLTDSTRDPQGFGFDVTYQQRNMIYVYYGNLGILLFKC